MESQVIESYRKLLVEFIKIFSIFNIVQEKSFNLRRGSSNGKSNYREFTAACTIKRDQDLLHLELTRGCLCLCCGKAV